MKKYKVILLVIGFICSIFCTYFLTEKYSHVSEFDGTIIKVTGDTRESRQAEIEEAINKPNSLLSQYRLMFPNSGLHSIQITTNYGVFDLIGEGITYKKPDMDVICLLKPRDEKGYSFIMINKKTYTAESYFIHEFSPDPQKIDTLDIFGKVQYKYLLETIPTRFINYSNNEK